MMRRRVDPLYWAVEDTVCMCIRGDLRYSFLISGSGLKDCVDLSILVCVRIRTSPMGGFDCPAASFSISVLLLPRHSAIGSCAICDNISDASCALFSSVRRKCNLWCGERAIMLRLSEPVGERILCQRGTNGTTSRHPLPYTHTPRRCMSDFVGNAIKADAARKSIGATRPHPSV